MVTKIEIHGFKSIRELNTLQLGPLNVFIGANGSGKSNLISFFKLLNAMAFSPGNLQFYISKAGGANTLLYDGATVTPQLSAGLTFQTATGLNEYFFRLVHAAPDTLIFAEEKIRHTPQGSSGESKENDWLTLGSGQRETNLMAHASQGNQTAAAILALLRQCSVYHFHNTAETARMRQRWDVYDDRVLKEDGANLAPFLRRLRDTRPRYYGRIVETIRQIVPFFADFVLESVSGTVLLQWRERGSDNIFGAHQASDGMLRVIALVSLLFQPEDELPMVLILDEPELGLHPYAMNILAGLLQSVATRTQLLLATQSLTLIDQVEPGEIVVVDRTARPSSFGHIESTFRRLDEAKLSDWLDAYSLAELWEKNVIGGRP